MCVRDERHLLFRVDVGAGEFFFHRLVLDGFEAVRKVALRIFRLQNKVDFVYASCRPGQGHLGLIHLVGGSQFQVI